MARQSWKRRSPKLREVVPFAGKITRRGPKVRFQFSEYFQVFTQGFRIEEVSLEVYELYAGLGGPPDFDSSGQPVATSLTLPFSWTPALPSSGNATYYCIVRRRNNYNLESFNVYSTIIQYIGHSRVLGPISPPRNVQVYDDGPQSILVVTKYVDTEDPDLPADTWEIYVKVGSDPVPGVDVPAYTGPMVFAGPEAIIAAPLESSSWVPGVVLHVIATAKRASDSRRGSAGVVLFTMLPSLDLTDGFMFAGRAANDQGPE